MNRRIIKPKGLFAVGIKLILAVLCGALMAGALLAQDAPQEERNNQDSSQERPLSQGPLEVTRPAPQPDLTVTDGEIVFTSPGLTNYLRSIRLSDNLGFLSLSATDVVLSPSGAAIYLAGTGTAYTGQIYFDSGAHDNAALVFRTAGSGGTITERMRVNASGNVGIGTASPNTKLHVYQGTSINNGQLQVGGTTFTGLQLSYEGIGSGRSAISDLNNSGGSNNQINFGFGTVTGGVPATAVMSINQSGNVGVGTTTPDRRLVVNGEIGFPHVDGFSYNGFRKNGVTTEYFNNLTLTASAPVHNFLSSGSTSRMVILESGNIGIGTASPQAKLDVLGGDIRVSGDVYARGQLLGPGTPGPQGPAGPQGPPGPAVRTSAICYFEQRPIGSIPSCSTTCSGGTVMASVVAPCQVTAETGNCTVPELSPGYAGRCCVCKP